MSGGSGGDPADRGRGEERSRRDRPWAPREQGRPYGADGRAGHDPTRWDAVRPDPTAAWGGGLLDDLPEQGRGAGSLRPPPPAPGPGTARRPGADQGRRERPNPFHTAPSEQGGPEAAEQGARQETTQRAAESARAASPRPSVDPDTREQGLRQTAEAPQRAAESARAASPRPSVDPDTREQGLRQTAEAPQRAAEPARAAPPRPSADQGVPQEAPHQDTDHSLEPNVIPFRGAGYDRTPAVPDHPGTHSPAADGAATAPAPVADPASGQRAADPPEPAAPEPQGESVNAHAAAPLPEPSEPAETAADPAGPASAAHAYTDPERAAVYRAIRERRDVRVGFRSDPVPDEVLIRVLQAAHQAPSVGFSQPWDFVVINDPDVRARVQDLVGHQRERYARALPGARARAFSGLKVEAILDTPANIVVTVDPTRGGRHTLGRHAQPQTAGYSVALAVENLWLAARAEGLGVGWVSFFEERDLARELDLPPHLEVVAYLCIGYVDDFPTEPELALGGWAQRRPLSWAVHRDHYGRRGLPGEQPTSLLEETIAAIGPPNRRAVGDARDRQGRMTKPPGALGVLEDISVQLAGLAGECPPPVPEPAAVAIFAGDHGVHAQGVTSWPQEVTTQMVHNFLDGGAVVNAFADQVGAEVTVVDVGVIGDLPGVPGLLPRKIARGTADCTQGPAMTRTQAGYAIEAGIEVARDLVAAGNRCLVTGDMGIANTTPSAALIAAFTGRDPAEVTGRGTGLDDAAHERKIEVVRRALEANDIDPGDPVGVLAAVGGLEHAALTGFVLGAAALRVPVLLDGVIAGAASLAVAALAPDALHACVAGHRSSEPGHAAVLEHLGLRPLVDLELRLGEGSGALLALPLMQGAVRALRDVATFDAAGVTERR
ncbi:nicotinate-nucleotide--dimethylbenzimidazole phosphoribosyltransferase [Spinactinospora alkalitolerans]|uniref:Nicotinate-nucleotide--dimethylbenzimidazole phosphoribosyltransferase n=1 Tax=Spinactinospora alkalitolerans TaxID=687207 RepID=A0A852TPJ2_9ACTN|nr:nicotinate-nucleotide--dimethylbenzimidazole phosphoribosyltransferase [Spinactinospora alkalitolerans]NYE46286.1 nicotinate-nucleotide--dimethylbenzimidazole phosphoribosyltransferase [Spinactinospora alkalitolerans]